MMFQAEFIFLSIQDSLQEETRAKLGLQSKLRQFESDQAALKEQNDEFEETKSSFEKQIQTLHLQVPIQFFVFYPKNNKNLNVDR